MVHAVLDTFLRAIPHTLAGYGAVDGTTLSVVVAGTGSGVWTWRYVGGGWRWTEPTDDVSALLTADADTLWRHCVRMIEPVEARGRVRVLRDESLANAALQIVSITR